MTQPRAHLGLFEYVHKNRSFKLHRPGSTPENATRDGTSQVGVSVTLKPEDEMWVISIPDPEEAGAPVKANRLDHWKTLTQTGVLQHPDEPIKSWKPTKGTRDMIAEVLADQGGIAWINDYLVTDSDGQKALERLLRNLGTIIPWGTDVNPTSDSTQENFVQAGLYRIKPRLGELTRELQQVGEKIDPLRQELGSLKSQKAALEEELGPLRMEKLELDTTLTSLRQEQRSLTEEHQRLQERLGEYRRYLAPRDQKAIDREVREEQWQPNEEVDALIHVKATLEAQGRNMSWADLLTIHLALQHAPFTILQGHPGAGKTTALQQYAQHIGMRCDPPIAVNTAWMSQEDVLGHYDMLAGKFVEGELGRILLAHQPKDIGEMRRVRLAILDEINLVTVEHVFSSMMSALALDHASQRTITLHRQAGPDLPPNEVLWPRGLLLAGTANNDHTVIAFSDRFRDRSAVHTLLPPSKADILATSLQGTAPIEAPKEPIKDLPCETWATWKAKAAATEDKTLQPIIEEFVHKIPVEQLSIRSLRRGTQMAKHAKSIIGTDALKNEFPKDPGEQNRLAVSLGLLPTLIQRAVHLRRPGQDRADLIAELSGIISSALGGQLEALKG